MRRAAWLERETRAERTSAMNIRGEIDIPHFKHWLSQQDPETEYAYCLASQCLVARYMQAYGFTKVDGGPWDGHGIRSDGMYVEFHIPDEIETAASQGGTYGGALALL